MGDRICSVYLYFDRERSPLYVGVTERGTYRLGEHAFDKWWWPHVATSAIVHCSTRARALDLESLLIQSLQPPGNVQHNGQVGMNRRDAIAERQPEIDDTGWLWEYITRQVKQTATEVRLLPRAVSTEVERALAAVPAMKDRRRVWYALPREDRLYARCIECFETVRDGTWSGPTCQTCFNRPADRDHGFRGPIVIAAVEGSTTPLSIR